MYNHTLDIGDSDALRAFAFQGIPDATGLRAKYWRVILILIIFTTAKYNIIIFILDIVVLCSSQKRGMGGCAQEAKRVV